MVVLLLALQPLRLRPALPVTAEVAMLVQAPPATALMQEPQWQVPTACLFILVLSQEQVYLGWLLSILFTVFLREIADPTFTEYS